MLLMKIVHDYLKLKMNPIDTKIVLTKVKSSFLYVAYDDCADDVRAFIEKGEQTGTNITLLLNF